MNIERFLNTKMTLEELYLSFLRETKVEDTSRGYHSGTMYMTLSIFSDKNEKVGYVDYSIYDDSIYIEMIEVFKEYQGHGYGKQGIQYLAGEYGYENIDWGEMTPDGFRLQQSLDKYYKFDRNKKQSKHLPKSTLYNLARKNKLLGEVAEIFYNNSYEKGWEELFKKFDFEELEKKLPIYDLNEISDIVSWIEDSKSNTNRPQDEVPSYIQKILSIMR